MGFACIFYIVIIVIVINIVELNIRDKLLSDICTSVQLDQRVVDTLAKKNKTVQETSSCIAFCIPFC